MDEPSITAWTMLDRRYGEPTRVGGDDALQATVPFSVSVAPAQVTR